MQVSPYLRRAQDRYLHYCPACDEVHSLPDSWSFNGDVNKPTFTPSFKHSGYCEDKVIHICHYILTDGIINYCGDCTHSMAGKSIPLPELPSELKD